MAFDPSRRAVLRAALGVSAFWGLGAAARPTVWARLSEVYDGYEDAITTARIYRLRTGAREPDPPGPGRATWANRMEYLLYRTSEADSGFVPRVLQLRTGDRRPLAPGPCRAFAKARSGTRVYFVRAGALWMQSMTAVFRGVEDPQRIADVPSDAGSVPGGIGVSPGEEEVYLSAGRADRRSRILSVDLASAETREIATLRAPVLDLQASPYGRGVLLALLGGHGNTSSPGGGAVRIEAATGSVQPLPGSSRARWKQATWWGRGHVLGIEERPDSSNEGDSRTRRAVWSELASETVYTLDSVSARSVGGSPDGRWIAVADVEGDVWIVHVPSRERRLLTGTGPDEVSDIQPLPAFTPDGRGVLMKSDRFGMRELVLAQLPEFTALPLPYERSTRRRRN